MNILLVYHRPMPTLTLSVLQEKLQAWKGCELANTAQPVFGEGNPHAKIFFIGEAPGQKEDELKRPFVGTGGKFLDSLLASINLKREDIYITNTVKYRPPENRDPTPLEKEQCMPWLMLELALIKPRIIVPLGRHSLGHFFPEITIGDAHGKPFSLTKDITIFPLYHPAAALHNGSLRGTLESDMRKLGDYLRAYSE
jgi:DNA polymerase